MSIFFRCVLFVSTVIAVSNGYAEDIVTTHYGSAYGNSGYGQLRYVPIKKHELKIVADATKLSFHAGEPIAVNVYAENISNESKNVSDTRSRISIIYDKDESKKILPLRYNESEYHLLKYGRSLPLHYSSVKGSILDAREKILQSTIQLNRLYDMTLEGSYDISIAQPINEYTKNDANNELVNSNVLTITVNEPDTEKNDTFKNAPSQIWSKVSHGLSISVVADKLRYEDYGAVYLRILSKNVSDSVLSTIIETKNVLDAYELTLLMPGGNLDFRKPATKDGSDVKKVDLTLFGKKLVSEKSKTAMPFVQIKPNEEAAESVIVLNRIFDMSTDGIYGLIVTKKIKDQNGNEQTISTEPFQIRIGNRPTEEEREADRLRRRLEGNDPDYPIWQSRDGLFKVIAKLVSVDKDIITLEKPDGKRTTFNISDLQPDNQKQISGFR